MFRRVINKEISTGFGIIIIVVLVMIVVEVFLYYLTPGKWYQKPRNFFRVGRVLHPGWEEFIYFQQGYKFEYPPEFFIEVPPHSTNFPPRTFFLKQKNAEGSNWLIEVNTYRGSIEDIKKFFIKGWAYGPEYYSKTLETKPFKSKYNVLGFEIYLNEAELIFNSPLFTSAKRKEKKTGPIFIFDHPVDNREKISFYLVGLPSDPKEKERAKNLLKEIASTFDYLIKPKK